MINYSFNGGRLHDGRIRRLHLRFKERRGEDRYVLERGLDIFRTDDPEKVIYFLTGGWNLKAVCRNGILYKDWRLSALSEGVPNYSICQRIFDILGLSPGNGTVSIRVQESYDLACACICIQMHLDIWRPQQGVETYCVTPMDNTVPDAYQRGQKKARDILDFLQFCGIKQDKEGLVKRLRSEQALMP